MTTGMDTDIDNTSDARKTAIINKELLRLKVDIATLQETHLVGQGSIRKNTLCSYGMVSLLTNVGSMVLTLLSRIRFYSMWKLIHTQI